MLRGFCGCSSRAESPRQPTGSFSLLTALLSPFPALPGSLPSKGDLLTSSHGFCVARNSQAGTSVFSSLSELPADPHLPLQPYTSNSQQEILEVCLGTARGSCEIQSLLEYQKGSELSKGQRVHHMEKPGFSSLCTKAEEGTCQFTDFLGWKGPLKTI